MAGQQTVPLGGVLVEVAWQQTGRGRLFGFQQRVKNFADDLSMVEQSAFKRAQRIKAHQCREPFAGASFGRDRVRLQIVIHLQPVLHVPQKAVGWASRKRVALPAFLHEVSIGSSPSPAGQASSFSPTLHGNTGGGIATVAGLSCT
jgi:hypothetical protein